MTTPRYLSCLGAEGFHRMAYREWGDPGNPAVLVCVHGLTRNGKDFTRFAEALAGDYRVIAPDVVGRGDSDRLADSSGYGYPQYLADMAALIARLDVPAVDWLGTSMGGLIGMMLAAQSGTPIRRLVMNDIGPLVPEALVERILEYIGDQPVFESIEAAAAHLRERYPGFGPLTDEEWREVAANSTRPQAGGYIFDYDPAIADPMRGGPVQDADMWAFWDRITCPVLVLHGEDSDALLPETADQMRRRGPGAEVMEIAEHGHAPPLLRREQIEPVRDWLLAG